MAKDFKIIIDGIDVSRLWLESNHDARNHLLESSFRNGSRPICMCVPGGLEMYISRHGDTWSVHRMPDTGHLHSRECISFEENTSISGRAWYSEAAIRHDAGNHKINFLDTSFAARAMVQKHIVSLNGLLCLLIQLAVFNQWSPHMAGKRNWGLFRFYLLQASERVVFIQGGGLTGNLFMPKPFNANKPEEYVKETDEFFAPGSGESCIGRFLIGEIKSIFPASKDGYMVRIKNMPAALYLPKTGHDLFTRYESYSEEMKEKTIRMLVILTVSMSRRGLMSIDGFGIQMLSKEWIPVESIHDLSLVSKLVTEKCRFSKPLRFDMPDVEMLHNALLLEDSAEYKTLDIVGESVTPEAERQKRRYIEKQMSIGAEAWNWDISKTGSQLMPDIQRELIGRAG